MTAYFKSLAVLVVIALIALLLKGCQTFLWVTKAVVLNPPSLESWDPTERWEAAREAGKKYGEKQ